MANTGEIIKDIAETCKGAVIHRAMVKMMDMDDLLKAHDQETQLLQHLKDTSDSMRKQQQMVNESSAEFTPFECLIDLISCVIDIHQATLEVLEQAISKGPTKQ